MKKEELVVHYASVDELIPLEENPRIWSEDAVLQLKESISRHGLVDPLLVNSCEARKNIVISGNFRLKVAKELGIKMVPVIYLNIPDINKERELSLRLNKNTGEFDWEALASFDEEFLKDIGFGSEELDDIFAIEPEPEIFDLQKELQKLKIEEIKVKKGDLYDLDGSRLYCGDSTIPEDIMALMGGDFANMCLTDPPYLLDYVRSGKRSGGATEGFGMKRNRRYLETDVIPPDFTEKWMANISQIAKPNFSIIVYENWKNIRIIWGEMEKYWKIKNMIVWHLNNRCQGFAAEHKFFNKHDIAMVGVSESRGTELNLEPEEELLQNEYQTALYAISGDPTWEGYEKGKKIQPTDFIEFKAADEKSSGQGIIFGTKPVEILIPYIKVLTKRGDLIVEPFGGSGSTLIAATMMNRRCYLMEKCPTYAEVILNRWKKYTGKEPKKIN